MEMKSLPYGLLQAVSIDEGNSKMGRWRTVPYRIW